MEPSHICFAIAGIIIAALYYRRMLQRHRTNANKIAAGTKDFDRQELYLKQEVIFVIKEIQSAWMENNLVKLNFYLERDLYTHWAAARIQVSEEKMPAWVPQAKLDQVQILDGKRFLGNTKDEFEALFRFSVTPAEPNHNGVANPSNACVTELWKMGRFQDRWKVRDITGTHVVSHLSAAV